MSKLEASLKDWVVKGFISRDQEKQILDYEASKPESSWILTGLLILGASVIGIGITSIIASNWENIPDAVKLFADFALLAALVAFAMKAWLSKKEIQFEVVTLGFMLACLASIGLISQIYHTGGKIYQALMLWAVITSGLQLATRYAFVPFIWMGAFLAGLTWMCNEARWAAPLFHSEWHPILFATPLLALCLALATKKLIPVAGASRAYFAWVFLTGAAALMATEIARYDRSGFRSFESYIPGLALAAISLSILLATKEMRRVQRVAIVSTLALYVIAFQPYQTGLLTAVLTIANLSALAIVFASFQMRRMFQAAIVLIGIRFLVLYFEVFGGLARTGFGLIASGAVVIGIAILWNKYRTKLAVWAEGVSR